MTTVDQPLAETGRLGASTLLDMLDGIPRPVQHVNLADPADLPLGRLR